MRGWFFRNEWRTKKKNKYVPRQINDRVIGFSRADKRDFVKAGANTMKYIYIICTIMCILYTLYTDATTTVWYRGAAGINI